MKTSRQKLKRASMIGLAVSAILWIALTYPLQNVTLFGYYIGEVAAFILGGIPAAFLQLRLCLTDKEKWVRWVPTAVAAAVYVAAIICYFAGGFGGELMALILFAACLAPTAGICIGWLAYGKRLALIPLNVALIAYMVMNGVPLAARPIELTDAAAIFYLLLGIYFAIRPLERKTENEPEN